VAEIVSPLEPFYCCTGSDENEASRTRRLSDSPPFDIVWEVADFVDQLLEVCRSLLGGVAEAAADLFLGSRIHAFTGSCPSVRSFHQREVTSKVIN
jgi:hypothetical protein